jgi:hypothetical protein
MSSNNGSNKKLLIIGGIVFAGLVICVLSIVAGVFASGILDSDEDENGGEDQMEENMQEDGDEDRSSDDDDDARTQERTTTAEQAQEKILTTQEEQDEYVTTINENIENSEEYNNIQLNGEFDISTGEELEVALNLEAQIDAESNISRTVFGNEFGSIYIITEGQDTQYFSGDGETWYKAPIADGGEDNIAEELAGFSDLEELVNEEGYDYEGVVECGEYFCHQFAFPDPNNPDLTSEVLLDVDLGIPRQLSVTAEDVEGSFDFSYEDVEIEIPSSAEELTEEEAGQQLIQLFFPIILGGQDFPQQ